MPEGPEGGTFATTLKAWFRANNWPQSVPEKLAKAIKPDLDPGDILIFDSWVLCVSTMSRPVPPLLGSADMCLGSHRANSNLREDEFTSKIGLVNVYCRPDCQRLDPPDGHKGKEEDELLGHAAEVQRRVAEGGMEGGRGNQRCPAKCLHQ